MKKRRDTEAVAEFVERFATAMVDAGVPRMPALVFATLLASDSGELDADELMTELHVSRAAVSGAVQYLTRVGMLRRRRQPGSRRERYTLQDETWYEAVARREQILDRWIETTRNGVNALGPTTPAGARLRESLAFFVFLRAEMPRMLARWQKQRKHTR